MPEHLKRAKKPEGYYTAHDIIRELRKELLSTAPGTFLGSASDLMSRFGISRSTLRQTVRVLEFEQLLVSKRGVAGGFYVSRPDAQSVVAAASAYLHSREATLSDFMMVATLLNVETARLASKTASAEMLQRLDALLERDWRNRLQFGRNLIRADQDLEDHLANMTNNPVIGLLLRVIYSLGLRTLRDVEQFATKAWARRWRTQRLALGEAILAQDTDRAVEIAGHHYEIIIGWMGGLSTPTPRAGRRPEPVSQ